MSSVRRACPLILPPSAVPPPVDNRHEGAGVLPLVRLEGGWAFVLGLENDGSYTGLFNLLCGRRDRNESAWECARREGREESCGLVQLPAGKQADERLVVGTAWNGTCIWAFVVDPPFTRADFTERRETELRGPARRSHLEMDELEFFYVDRCRVHTSRRHDDAYEMTTVDGREVGVSRFAVAVCQLFFGDTFWKGKL